MSINTPAPADSPHPVTGPAAARARVHRLHQRGSSYQAIAVAAGLVPATVRDLAYGRLRDKVITLYDAWWDKRAPERTRFERGAATAARKRAIAGNWCAGAGLDDDQPDTGESSDVSRPSLGILFNDR